MTQKQPSLNLNIRQLKDFLIRRYFKLRINTTQDPYKIQLRTEPYRTLFILGHMRSGSSLLTHILTSNPEIIGFGESHIQYTSEQDIKHLLLKVYWQIREYKMQQKYILDKILHDQRILDENLLKSQNSYSIFLIREPQRTLASLLDIKAKWTEENALQYYCQRLLTLENYAKIINNKNNSLLVEYDNLVQNPQACLKGLKRFLETQTDFSEQYQVGKTTGIKGVGDSSQNIKAGRIIQTKREVKRTISQAVLDVAQQHFEHCSQELSKYCSTLEV